MGGKNSKLSIGSHGHIGDTRPGQIRKTPLNLSAHESEERGRGESGSRPAVKVEECVYFYGFYISL